MKIYDRKAYSRLRRIVDFDVKAKVKEGLSAVANGIAWTSAKIKERIDPAGYASEQEARAADKQRLKELSTIRGLLKECGKIIKSKLVDATGPSVQRGIDKLRAILDKLKEKISTLGTWASQNKGIIISVANILAALIASFVFAYKAIKKGSEQERINEINFAGFNANKVQGLLKKLEAQKQKNFAKTKAAAFNILATNRMINVETANGVFRPGNALEHARSLDDIVRSIEQLKAYMEKTHPTGNQPKTLAKIMKLVRNARNAEERIKLRIAEERNKTPADYNVEMRKRVYRKGAPANFRV